VADEVVEVTAAEASEEVADAVDAAEEAIDKTDA